MKVSFFYLSANRNGYKWNVAGTHCHNQDRGAHPCHIEEANFYMILVIAIYSCGFDSEFTIANRASENKIHIVKPAALDIW